MLQPSECKVTQKNNLDKDHEKLGANGKKANIKNAIFQIED